MTINLQEFQQSLLYSVQKQPLEIAEDLNKIGIFNNQVAEQVEKFSNYQLIAIICLVISLFLLLVRIGIVLLVPSLFAIFYFNYQHQKYLRLQIDSYRYQISKKIVELLNRDIQENTNLITEIDFNKPINEQKQIDIIDHPLRSGWKIKIYQDPWFNIRGELSDRTKFRFNITENHRNVSGWKRSRSGKRKHKSKNKFKGSELTLQLRYPSRKYGAVQVLKKDAIKAIKLPDTAKLKNFKITEKSILIKVYLPSKTIKLTHGTFTSMLLSCYQVLNLARLLSKTAKK